MPPSSLVSQRQKLAYLPSTPCQKNQKPAYAPSPLVRNQIWICQLKKKSDNLKNIYTHGMEEKVKKIQVKTKKMVKTGHI